MLSLTSLAFKLPSAYSTAISRAGVLSCLVPSQQTRLASGHGFGGRRYIESPNEGPPEQYTEVEKSYAEWKYVEKVLPKKYVPEPPQDPSIVHTSGWKAPAPVSRYAQYVIPRNKNHLPPVYLNNFIVNRGQRRWTRIKNVEGNIWALEQDIGNHLKKLYPQKRIMTWVNENFRIVYIQGQYEEEVRDWVVEQGF